MEHTAENLEALAKHIFINERDRYMPHLKDVLRFEDLPPETKMSYYEDAEHYIKNVPRDKWPQAYAEVAQSG